MVVNPLDLWLQHSAAKQKEKLNARAKTGKVIDDHLAVDTGSHTLHVSHKRVSVCCLAVEYKKMKTEQVWLHAHKCYSPCAHICKN